MDFAFFGLRSAARGRYFNPCDSIAVNEQIVFQWTGCVPAGDEPSVL